MNPSLTETIYADFITSSPTTGAAVDADSLPTCEVFEDNTDTAILSPTVVKRTGKTGNYRIPIACTAGNGFEAGKSYNVIVSATVGAVAAKAVVQTFQIRTSDTDDLAKTGDAMTLTAAYDPAKTAAQAGAAMTLTTGGVDSIWAKTMTELSAVPGVTASTLSALQWIFLLARNKITQTSTTQTLRNDADSATIATSTVSDDGTTFVRNEFS
jgi:hypothetical protein